MSIGAPPLNRPRASLALASIAIVTAMAVPAVAGARPVQRDDISVNHGVITVEAKRPAVDATHEPAQENISSLGKVERCPTGGLISLFHKSSFRRIVRFLRCFEQRIRAAEDVMGVFLVSATISDGTTACALMTSEERARRGGPVCAENVEAASLAARRPEGFLQRITVGRGSMAEFSLLLHKPREGGLVQLDVVHRHFRMSYTRQLFE